MLTDSWTSFGVVGGLLLVIWTGWKPFDPLLAIAVAANIVWSGGTLFWSSVKGLMDYADPEIGMRMKAELEAIRGEYGIDYHELRFRSTGSRTLVEVHLLFPFKEQLGRAHAIATEVERRSPGIGGRSLGGSDSPGSARRSRCCPRALPGIAHTFKPWWSYAEVVSDRKLTAHVKAAG